MLSFLFSTVFFHWPHFGSFILLILKRYIIHSDLVLDKKYRGHNLASITCLLVWSPRSCRRNAGPRKTPAGPGDFCWGIFLHTSQPTSLVLEKIHYVEDYQGAALRVMEGPIVFYILELYLQSTVLPGVPLHFLLRFFLGLRTLCMKAKLRFIPLSENFKRLAIF